MGANDPQCGNCKFWRNRTDSVADLGGGYCQRFPPIFKLENSLNDGWPNTHQQELCGEWQRGKNKLKQ